MYQKLLKSIRNTTRYRRVSVNKAPELIGNELLFFRDDVQKLFEEKDRDHDGYLSFEEFTGQETKIEIAFKAMDKDGDGFISKDEFRRVCKGLTPDQVEAAFKKFDKEGNGMLNYREFCKMMNTRKEKKAAAAASSSKE